MFASYTWFEKGSLRANHVNFARSLDIHNSVLTQNLARSLGHESYPPSVTFPYIWYTTGGALGL